MVDALEPSKSTAASRAPGLAPLLVVLGSTAAGKSALGLTLAERLRGEIVNYDSVQVYRGFLIGSGKVPPEERRGIPHHLLDAVEPDQVFTAGDYRRLATRVLESLRERGKLPILVGGTGLYLRALLAGLFEGPARSDQLRARLNAIASRRDRSGDRPGESPRDRNVPDPVRSDVLHRMLRRLDPATAARIHPRDRQKIIRAIEVCWLAREPLSRMLERGRTGLEGFEAVKVGLCPDRARLHERINRRVEGMFAAGLIEETRLALERQDASRLKPLEALGYRQALAALRGQIGRAEAIRQTQAATRQYAKRQITWFRREADITWFAGFGDDPTIQQQVLDWLASKRGSQYAFS
jgi:tRNA dimethylallyltransferase